MQEDFVGRAVSPKPLHAIIDVDPAIPVPSERPPRGEQDPLLVQLEAQLSGLLEKLSTEANSYPIHSSLFRESPKVESNIFDSSAAATDSAITESRMLL